MAPDLAKVPQRLRAAWLDQWLADPGRIAPGTRMPSNFPTDPSENAYPDVLGGDQKKQIEAVRSYLLTLGPRATPGRERRERDRLGRARARGLRTSPSGRSSDPGGIAAVSDENGESGSEYRGRAGRPQPIATRSWSAPTAPTAPSWRACSSRAGSRSPPPPRTSLAPDVVPPALVLLDDSGARADRMEAFRRLRQHPALRGVPVVVLAYDADIDSYSDAITKGAAAYLVKPVNADELVAVARKISRLDERDRPHREAPPPAPSAAHEGGRRDQVEQGRRCPARSSTSAAGGCRIELSGAPRAGRTRAGRPARPRVHHPRHPGRRGALAPALDRGPHAPRLRPQVHGHDRAPGRQDPGLRLDRHDLASLDSPRGELLRRVVGP